jgi:hypothetical protein
MDVPARLWERGAAAKIRARADVAQLVEHFTRIGVMSA